MKRLILSVLAIALCLGCFAGCKSGEGSVTTPNTEVTATPTPTATPIPTPDVPVTPEVVVTTPNVQQEQQPADVNVEIHGEEEVVTMTAVSGTFASAGGPSFTLLVDRERYQVNDVSGYCYITLRTGMSGDVYAEIGFRSGQTADSIGTGILSEYGVMSTVTDLGREQLGNNSVIHLRGETVQNIFDVYLLDTNGGCVTLVTSTTAETEAHRARLTASLESLEIH
ncbi:MAG: hypothetical protein IJD81_11875 [Oscillospiraceae bacterium]|nr:hypothetical protein [Oscillospiraceae bacterium]